MYTSKLAHHLRSHDVDWSAYAEVYDLMAANNPAYQHLVAAMRTSVSSWCLRPGAAIADLGAGTGNFSIELAQLFPQCTVWHLDIDRVMVERAQTKALALGLDNMRFLTSPVDAATFAPGTLDGVVTVHALYAFPEPRKVISHLFDWLRPGGYLFACNAGRQLDMADWSKYLLGESVKRRGLLGTVKFFYRAREVSAQNRRIAALQRAGIYWTHSHEEFRQSFVAAGFTIRRSLVAYRGASDIVEARRPEPVKTEPWELVI